MTDEQLWRLQRTAAKAAVRDGSNVVYLPGAAGGSWSEPGPIHHDTEHGVFRREIGPDLAMETPDTCAICGQPSDEPVTCSECSQRVVTAEAIEEALHWHREHTGTDHLDAAFAAARFAGELGQSRWPEFVAAVKDVTEASDAFRAAGLEVER